MEEDDCCVSAKRNYIVRGRKQSLQCGARIRKSAGFLGGMACSDDDSININTMTPVWQARFPSRSVCGGERHKEGVCDVTAPGFENQSVRMIDDYTYMTYIDIP